jgi:hypothetical protein
MLTLEELSRSLYGALRLARFDPRGMDYFDLSVEGFWRSFAAVLIVLPGYIVLVLRGLHAAAGAAAAGAMGTVLLEAAGFCLKWFGYLIVVLFLGRLLGFAGNFVPFVIAYNWAGVWQILVLLAAVLLASLFPPLAELVVLASLIAILVYQWFVTRTALDCPASVAAGLVLLDFLLSVLIDVGIDRL